MKKKIMKELLKLAFSKSNDLVLLFPLLEEGEFEQIRRLNLFGIDKIKKTKDGYELSCADRIEAAKMLISLMESEEKESKLKGLFNLLDGSDESETI